MVKVLRPKILEKQAVFAACALGIAREGEILSKLNHPNIIQLRAIAQGGIATYACGRSDAYFLVLDRLSVMLSDRLVEWKQRSKHLKFAFMDRARKRNDFFLERLKVAAQLADALAYLHSRNVLHRDLKPSNIGFDSEGTLKVFDFDVSKILPESEDPNEEFKLTARIGTRRYMSPECGLGCKYNLKADVYSFAILLHQILSLKVPFKGIGGKLQHAQKVFLEGERPVIPSLWPISIQRLIQQSWSCDIRARPTMNQNCETLTKQISEAKMKLEKDKPRNCRTGSETTFISQ